MISLTVLHVLIIVSVILLLFGGRKKVSSIPGDFAQGIDAFKKGLAANKDPTPQIIGVLFVILGILGLFFAVTHD
jgi:sec-independent protein translocase protein TatA